MSLEEKKIKTYADNVKELSDYPSEDGIGPKELKAIFDGRGDKEIKNTINGIVDELIANTGASQIGSAEGNVQRELDLKVSKENAEAIGSFEVSTWGGEGSIKITPAVVGETAEIKLSDDSGSCAALEMDFDGSLRVSYGNDYINEKEKLGEVYTSLSHPYMDLVEAQLSEEEQAAILGNLGITAKVKTENISFRSGEIYSDGESIIINRPALGMLPGSALEIECDLYFNQGDEKHEIYHEGNLKDLTRSGQELSEDEKGIFMSNTGLREIIGDMEVVLDVIVSLQNAFIGGDA